MPRNTPIKEMPRWIKYPIDTQDVPTQHAPRKSLGTRFLDLFRAAYVSPEELRLHNVQYEKSHKRCSLVTKLIFCSDSLEHHGAILSEKLKGFSTKEVTPEIIDALYDDLHGSNHWDYVMNVMATLNDLASKGSQTFGDAKTYLRCHPVLSRVEELTDFIRVIDVRVVELDGDTQQKTRFKSAPEKLLSILKGSPGGNEELFRRTTQDAYSLIADDITDIRKRLIPLINSIDDIPYVSIDPPRKLGIFARMAVRIKEVFCFKCSN
jgi:hypothetical protein